MAETTGKLPVEVNAFGGPPTVGVVGQEGIGGGDVREEGTAFSSGEEGGVVGGGEEVLGGTTESGIVGSGLLIGVRGGIEGGDDNR